MKIYLCAREDDLFNAWKTYTQQFDFVEATKQAIMYINADAIVSPANSFGFMTGGIDLHYINYFGKEIAEEVRHKIVSEFNGELCVGQAMSVKLKSGDITKYKHLIVAPTMRVPENVGHTINAFLAAKAALIEANKLDDVESIVFPGLGTGTGTMRPDDCAKQVAEAIKYVLIDEIPYTGVEDLYQEQDFVRKKIASSRWFEVQRMY